MRRTSVPPISTVWMLLVAALPLGCGGRAASSNEVGGAGGAGASAGAANAGEAGEGGIDWAACEPSDACLLETQTACGAGCEPVDLARFIPINAKYDAAYREQRINPPCLGIECMEVPPSSVNTPNYYASCLAGRCKAFDIRTSELSACTSDAQCGLRSGADCCACGSDDLVAVNTSADLGSALCGANETCPRDCVEPPPPLGGARCTAGHCALQD